MRSSFRHQYQERVAPCLICIPDGGRHASHLAARGGDAGRGWAVPGGSIDDGPSDLPMGAYGFRCSLWRPVSCTFGRSRESAAILLIARWSVGDLKLGVAGYQECLSSAPGGGTKAVYSSPRPSGRFETGCSGYQDPGKCGGSRSGPGHDP